MFRDIAKMNFFFFEARRNSPVESGRFCGVFSGSISFFSNIAMKKAKVLGAKLLP